LKSDVDVNPSGAEAPCLKAFFATTEVAPDTKRFFLKRALDFLPKRICAGAPETMEAEGSTLLSGFDPQLRAHGPAWVRSNVSFPYSLQRINLS
jgi:hypothetical protein